MAGICRLTRLNPGAWWGGQKCLLIDLKGKCPESVLDSGGGIKLTVKFRT